MLDRVCAGGISWMGGCYIQNVTPLGLWYERDWLPPRHWS
jgi:hypothetical protein